ncbi:TAXI family TRAP transporter solute-binding subunit [Thiomonas intermedia]|uniref:TAXI family TRAP transporter solute-binding subunit n=1 Tax=Thiomonas intermedia TaxID=926 RepID=UPI0009A48A35|nr:TAXI family TRAP transporter solute-binding subunit [Thiomonas intermedia]
MLKTPASPTRRRVLALAGGAALLSPLGLRQAFAAEYITIATGGTSGVYYPLGVALSQIYTKAIPAAKSSVQATKGSVENLNLLEAGRAELGFSLGDSLSDAWKGEADAGFKAPLKKLRTMAAIYSNYVQIVARADSGIKSLADLKGKSISVGAPKSGTELNARALLKAAGLSYKDFSKVEYLPFGESVELMKNRQLDATLQSAGLGVASLRDLAASQKIVVVPVPDDVIAKVGDPAYQSGVIPAHTYEGQTSAVPTARIQNFLVTREGLSEDLVYQMTKAMFTNLPELVAAHAAAKGISLKEAPLNAPVPLHPGAAKYYREAGVLK